MLVYLIYVYVWNVIYVTQTKYVSKLDSQQTSWIGENIKQKMLKWQMLNVQKKNIFCSI